MNVQFNHNRTPFIGTIRHNTDFCHALNGTLAIDVSDKAYLERIFSTHSTQGMFTLGISVMSKKDQFEKKVGREKALSRMTEIVCDLSNVSVDGTKHLYYFYTNSVKINDKNYHINFQLSTVAESDKVKLIYSYISETNHEW